MFRASPTGPDDSARLVANRERTSSFGWDLQLVVRNRTNAQGFVAAGDYQAGSSIIGVFGDSFAEGATLDYPQSLVGQLAARTPGLPVYGFGFAGTGLPHHLGMVKEMSRRYQLKAAVIVVTPGDFAEGFDRAPGLYHWSGSAEAEVIALAPEKALGAAAKVLRESALVRYLRANLRFTPAGLFKRPALGHQDCKNVMLAPEDLDRLRRFVAELAAVDQLRPEHVVLVFDSDRDAIYSELDRGLETAAKPEGTAMAPCTSVERLALEVLASEATAAGMKVVRTERLFGDYYAATRRLLDSSPLDGHWNAAGVGLIIGEVMKRITEARL
jgi:hypothetical protein